MKGGDGAPPTPGRYCPECDERVDTPRCPIHEIPTLPIPEVDELGLSNGAVVAGRYEIEGRVGSGAMGAVYVARQLSVDRLVALKLLKPELVREGYEAVQRFYREARNASRLNHPHVVRIFDFGVDEILQSPFLVMEMVEGPTLADFLEARGRLSLDQACEILVQVARALSAAHALEIVHRDLKPDNIIIQTLPGGELHVIVLDFGVAKRVSGPDQVFDDLTGAGMIVGTPRYMSPEQVSAVGVTPAADIYSLGCIFYELLEGKAPFLSDADSNVLLKHINSPAPRLSHIPEGPVGDAAQMLYLGMMAKDPKARPASAEEVVRSLKSLRSEGHDGQDGLRPGVQEDDLTRVRPDSGASHPRPDGGRPDEGRPEGGRPDEGRPGGDSKPGLASDTAADRPSPVTKDGSSPAESVSSEAPPPPHEPRSKRVEAAAEVLPRDYPEPVGPIPGEDTASVAAPDRTLAETSPAPRGRRWGAVLALLALLGAGVAAWLWTPPPVANPFLAPRAVLACPVFEVEGLPAPAGWLGAAAADAFCRRARWWRGGRYGSVQMPAELLGIAPLPSGDETPDPFMREDSVSASRAAAARASGWIAGSIRLDEDRRFHVRVQFMVGAKPLGAPVLGEGRAPFEAVVGALEQANAALLFPRAETLDPEIARWWKLDRVEQGLLLEEFRDRAATGLDFSKACRQALLPTQPQAFIESMGDCPEVDVPLPVPEPLGDEALAALSGPDLVWRALFVHALASEHLDEARTLLARLAAEKEKVTEPEGRFLIDYATALTMRRVGEPLFAVYAGRLLEMRPYDVLVLREAFARDATARRQDQWAGRLAWHPNALETHRKVPKSLRRRLVERIFLLSGGAASEFPDDAYKYGHALVLEGQLAEVRRLAAQLLAGHPRHRKNAILLDAEVNLAEGEFARVAAQLVAFEAHRGYVPLVRHLLNLVELAPSLADTVDPYLAETCKSAKGPEGPIDLALIQLEIAAHRRGTIGQACLRAYDEMATVETADYFGHCRNGIAALLAGKEGEAVAHWRRIRPLGYGCRMPVAIYDAVDAALGEHLDADLLDDATYGGAHPAQAREARRAARRGARPRAAALAQRVVTAWRAADVKVPVVEEMKRLTVDRAPAE